MVNFNRKHLFRIRIELLFVSRDPEIRSISLEFDLDGLFTTRIVLKYFDFVNVIICIILLDH